MCTIDFSFIGSIILFALMRHGNLSEIGIPSEGTGLWILYVVGIITIVSVVVAAVTSRIPLHYVQRIITQLNTLASGNFKTRLEFGYPLLC